MLSCVANLERFPFMGRRGELEGIREMVLSRWPYVVVYKVEQGDPEFEIPVRVVVMLIRHAAMQWPPDRPP